MEKKMLFSKFFFGFPAFFFLLLPIYSRPAAAYPTFVAFQYRSCLNCHYLPQGGGPLTDYGRALSATTLSAKPFYQSNATEEELTEQSSFLPFTRLAETLPWLRPSIKVRDLLLASDLVTSSRALALYLMQLDANLLFTFSEGRWLINLGGGLARVTPGSGDSPLISREHWIGGELLQDFGGGSLRAYMGLMTLNYGINIPDHTASSRLRLLSAQNDQTHGALFHYSKDTWDIGLQGFLGNLLQAHSLRLRGFSISGGVEIASKVKLGASLLHQVNDFRSRWSGSLHSQLTLSEGHGCIIELGTVSETTSLSGTRTGPYLMAQSFNRLARGVYLLSTIDFGSTLFFGSTDRRLAPSIGVQIFPFQRLELRSEFQSENRWEITGLDGGYQHRLNWLTQVHLYL